MGQLKYSKYIIKDHAAVPAEVTTRKTEQRNSGSYVDSIFLLRIEESTLERALYTDVAILWHKQGPNQVQTEVVHTHEFDEILGFVGTRRENPRELNADIEFWLEDEKYNISESCLIFIPRNMRHCPIRFHRIDSPVVFFSTGNGTTYKRDELAPWDPVENQINDNK